MQADSVQRWMHASILNSQMHAAMGRFPYQNIGIDAWSSMPIAVTPSLYVTDTLCVGHMYHIMALP